MKREIRKSEIWLIFGYSIILIFMVVQDWVPLGPLNDIDAIREVKSIDELIVTTLIGVFQILILMAIILLFVGKKYPIWAKLWLVIHPCCIFLGALMSWWVPYLFGIGAKVKEYEEMFGNTHTFLPIMNGVVPNTLHIIFHFTLLSCIITTLYIFIKKENFNKKPSTPHI